MEDFMQNPNENLQGSDFCLMFLMALAVWLWVVFR
jgi:hypothetical protein